MVPKPDSGRPGIRGWFTYERRNWIAMILLGAGLGAAFGQDRANEAWVAKETAKQVAPVVAQKKIEDKALVTVTAQLGCQKNRAEVATLSAIGSGDPSAIPSCPPAKLPPAVLAVIPPPLKGALKQ